ncbi:insulinase family protein [Pyxidicoccus fallax]|uniref:Insulinase family protein n=1 Tax=Pyxidicoccus fallax TaxID=394095 RepID=A0A848LYW9_9BACT|nr:pitrilysin family protein [Pyxidicoccus fallax]NMO22821.1 insulinase family protein [Pyxidicoccus fallax]NPC85001.1 insulinase family protein [Pyxidicoccus fallax]
MAIRYALPNGLTVVFEEQHAAKVAAFQVWVKVGSADERPDQAGLAHLHEHMLFKGTERRGPGEIARDVESHGGEINAWTSFDQTVYHIVIASQFARTGLDILGDAVRRSAFDAEELAREIEVVCEEIKRSQDTPSRRASRDLFATSYQVHPYRLPVIGTEQSVRSFTREKVLEFYHRHYTPKNLVLSVAGDLREAELRQWVEEIFGGDWGRPYEGEVKRPSEPAAPGRRILLRPDDVKEAWLHLSFGIPQADHPDVPALDVLAMIAGQGDASRLTREVKRRHNLVNEVHAYAYTPRDPGLFSATMTLQPGNAARALEETARVFATLRATPVTEDELATAKALVEAEAVYQRETVQGMARKMGFYQSGMGSLEAEARYYEAVRGLTPEHLRAAAERYLRFDRAVVTGLLPHGADFTEAQVHEVLDRVGREPAAAPPERKPRKVAAGEPSMRIAKAASAGPSDIIQEKLPSGATVLVRVEPAVPLFAVRAVFAGGLRYETPADNGITTLLTRCLTRGTPSHDAEDISQLIDAYAGSLGGQGGRNSVSLRGEFLSRHFEPAFRLFADCLLEPSFPEVEVARERTLMLQDILTREDKPSSVAFDLFSRTLYRTHPYRMPTLGEQASVEALTPDMLRAWHVAHMDPSQLTLCVVGDVKVDEVMALAREYFGKPRGKAVPPPRVEAEPPPEAPRQDKKVLNRAQSHIVLGFPGARVGDAWRHELEVLSTVLSGQGGRLFVELRDKRSMAYSVSSFAIEGVDPGYFAVYMGTSPEKVDAALAGIRKELERIRDEPIPEEELARAKQHLIGTHEIGLQRNGSRAGLLAMDACYGLGLDNFLHYADHIAAVTSKGVQEVARRVIDFDRGALAIVGP